MVGVPVLLGWGSPAALSRPMPNYARAGDGVQRPLRSRFPPRLTPSVAMTSDVKG